MTFDPSVEARKDFTPAQAVRWVRQEAAKHTTPESRAERIISARAVIAKAKELGLNHTLPTDVAAHELLIKVLTAELEVGER